MKKQQKQRDEQTKQNTNADSNENRTPVSEDTKQKLVKQYRDRAEASPSRSWDENIGGQYSADDRYKNGPEYGWPQDKNLDVQYRPSGEMVHAEYDPSGIWGYNPVHYEYPEGFEHPDNTSSPLGEGLGNLHSWEGVSDGNGIDTQNYSQQPLLRYDTLRRIVNDMSNVEMSNYGKHKNQRPNMLYGYGHDPLDYESVTEHVWDYPELQNWLDAYDVVASPYDQERFTKAFELMRNANDYYRQQELDQYAQDMRNQQLYGDALMELMAQQQAQNNNRSLLEDALQQIREQEILENRPASRQRHITGSGHF